MRREVIDPAERVQQALAQFGVPFEILDCDPELADTAVFCEHYGYALDNSANCLLVASKTGEKQQVACVLLANTRLDVNRTVRKKMGVRRLSFASAEETLNLTGMELGGVTPLALPETVPLWVDQRIMEREYIILGGGNRSSKVKVAPALFQQTPNTTIIDGLALAVSES